MTPPATGSISQEAETARSSVRDQTPHDEARLLFLLSRLPQHVVGRTNELVQLARSVDQERFVEACTAHAVYPLVYENLKRDVPEVAPELLRRLEPLFHASFRNGLLLTHALFDVLDYLGKAGIRSVCFKGPVFAAQRYGDLRRRVYGDLDLFVRVADVNAAAATLRELGFRQIDPLPENLRGTFRGYWPFGHPHGNAVGFARAASVDGQVDVDLQWGVAPHFLKIPIDPAPLLGRAEFVELQGRHVETFDAEDTLVLMCLHGAKHAWTELRQIVDVAACIPADPSFDWDRVSGQIADAGIVRMCALAFRLAEEVAGASVPDTQRARLLNERERTRMDALVARVMEWRFGPSVTSPRSDRRRLLGALRFHLQSRDRLVDGLGSVVFHVRDLKR